MDSQGANQTDGPTIRSAALPAAPGWITRSNCAAEPICRAAGWALHQHRGISQRYVQQQAGTVLGGTSIDPHRRATPLRRAAAGPANCRTRGADRGADDLGGVLTRWHRPGAWDLPEALGLVASSRTWLSRAAFASDSLATGIGLLAGRRLALPPSRRLICLWLGESGPDPRASRRAAKGQGRHALGLARARPRPPHGPTRNGNAPRRRERGAQVANVTTAS